jgi:hypothetical protein
MTKWKLFRFNKSVSSIFEFQNVKIIKRGKANDNASQRRDYSLAAPTTADIFHRSNTDAFQFPGDLRFASCDETKNTARGAFCIHARRVSEINVCFIDWAAAH